MKHVKSTCTDCRLVDDKSKWPGDREAPRTSENLANTVGHRSQLYGSE